MEWIPGFLGFFVAFAVSSLCIALSWAFMVRSKTYVNAYYAMVWPELSDAIVMRKRFSLTREL